MNPGLSPIQTERLFDSLRNLDCQGRIDWRLMADRCDDYPMPAIDRLIGGENDCAGPVLAPLLKSGKRFPFPQIGISDDETGLRLRKRHLWSSSSSKAFR